MTGGTRIKRTGSLVDFDQAACSLKFEFYTFYKLANLCSTK
ncbi:hypothetical protein UF75_2728 [Desulfosporosinus sp. I2]|nr:hypothetical protein UF75_2728 [Desulfosporosinus sp. I2]